MPTKELQRTYNGQSNNVKLLYKNTGPIHTQFFCKIIGIDVSCIAFKTSTRGFLISPDS